MPLEQFSNAAQTTLSAAVTTTTATSVSVTSSSAFPAIGTGGTQQFRVLVDSEILIVTAVSGTTWTVIRGAEGTTAATHLISASVIHVLTAGSLENYSYPFPQIDSSPAYDAAVFSGNTVSLPTADPLIVSDGNTVVVEDSGLLQFYESSVTLPSWGAAGDIGVETFGASASAGTTGKMADAGHVHQMPAAPSGGSLTILAKTASYTLTATEVSTWVTVSSASATTITVPSATFSAGDIIYVQQIGAGQVTISGSGTTLTSTGATAASPKTRAQYSSASILCTASNTFTVVGDIA